MLVGGWPPVSRAERLFDMALVTVFFSPWVLLGSSVALVGLVDIVPRRCHPSERGAHLVAGAAVLAGVGGLWFYHFRWEQRWIINRFEFDGAMLHYQTARSVTTSVAVAEMTSVTEHYPRRDPHRLWGWWLVFEGGGEVFLSCVLVNAEELVRQLSAAGVQRRTRRCT